LAVANYDTTTVSVLRGSGNGAFLGKADADAGNSPFPVVLGDVNGDGVADVVVANFWSSTASVLLGLGGTSAPSGVRLVAGGASQAYTITPQAGYAIGDVRVDGVSHG